MARRLHIVQRWRRVKHVVRRELDRGAPVFWTVADPRAGGHFAGRTVVVSGAAGMIGSHVVDALAAQGAAVHAVDRDAQRLDGLVGRFGHAVTAWCADLADEAEVHRVAAGIAATTDALDAVVHLVGGNDPAEPLAIDAAAWRRVLEMNLVAPALLTQALVPLLARVPASGVVFTTSVNGRTTSQWPHYAAAKAGLAKVTGDLALHLAPQGIRVNAVAPGWVAEVGDDGRAGRRGDRHAPLTRSAVPPAAIVEAVLFLADPARSPCTTGQELGVDAGAVLETAMIADWRAR